MPCLSNNDCSAQTLVDKKRWSSLLPVAAYYFGTLPFSNLDMNEAPRSPGAGEIRVATDLRARSGITGCDPARRVGADGLSRACEAFRLAPHQEHPTCDLGAGEEQQGSLPQQAASIAYLLG